MQKKFLSSLLLLLFLNVLIKPVWIFGIDLTVQNRVGASEYGLYAAIFSFALIFNILLDVGLTHYNNQAIARRPDVVARNFSRLTSLKLALAGFYLLVALILGAVLGYLGQAPALLFTLALCQVLASFLLFLRSHLAGLHLFRLDSLLSVADKLLMVISCSIMLFTWLGPEEFSVLHFAGAQLGSYLLAAALGFVLVWRRAGRLRWHFRWRYYLTDLGKSLPYALLILLMALYTRVDSIMLEQIKGPFENGIYAQAFRLLDAVNQMGYLISVLLLPMFSGMLARQEDLKPLTRLSFSLVFILTLAITLSALSGAEALMGFLYVEHSTLSAPVFRLLLPGSIAFGTTYVFGTLLTARGNLRLLNSIALSGFGLNVLLNFWLIPRQGASGAALATLATQYLTAGFQLIFALRYSRFSFGARYWWRLFSFVLAALGASWSLTQMTGNWLLIAGYTGVAVFILAFVFRLFTLRAILDLLRSRFAAR